MSFKAVSITLFLLLATTIVFASVSEKWKQIYFGVSHIIHLASPPINFNQPIVEVVLDPNQAGVTRSVKFSVMYSDFYDIAIYCKGVSFDYSLQYYGNFRVTLKQAERQIFDAVIINEKARYFRPKGSENSDLIVLETLTLDRSPSPQSKEYELSIEVLKSNYNIKDCDKVNVIVRVSGRP
jgi:hypothetical protein